MSWNFVPGKLLSGRAVLQKAVTWNVVLGKSISGCRVLQKVVSWSFVLGKSLSGCRVLQTVVCWNFVLGKSLLGLARGRFGPGVEQARGQARCRSKLGVVALGGFPVLPKRSKQ